MAAVQLRDEALLMLEGRGLVLDAARFASHLIRSAGFDAGLIGGVAVYAWGHLQATAVVTLCVRPLDADAVANLLCLHGCHTTDDPHPGSLRYGVVPIRLDDLEDVPDLARSWCDVDGLRVMSLPLFIELQLRRATRSVAHVGGHGDVVALIRANRLPLSYAAQLRRSVRDDFRRLVRAVRAERNRPPPDDPFSHSR